MAAQPSKADTRIGRTSKAARPTTAAMMLMATHMRLRRVKASRPSSLRTTASPREPSLLISSLGPQSSRASPKRRRILANFTRVVWPRRCKPSTSNLWRCSKYDEFSDSPANRECGPIITSTRAFSSEVRISSFSSKSERSSSPTLSLNSMTFSG